MSKRLWDKGIQTDAVMHRLSVGDDPIYDQKLLRWDCVGSAAQARVLKDAGIISKKELRELLAALKKLLQRADAGAITISQELEDAHTTIESLLVSLVGDAGKKIHTGRSRNDQVILASRLYYRSVALVWIQKLILIVELFSRRYAELKNIPMPGYTHLQPGMPSTLGMWLHAFLEGGLELIRDGFSFLRSVDKNPLGASAGFGSSLPLDRELSAKLLGFSGAQRSFIDIQNSRGRYEEKLLFWGSQIGALFEKFAWDVELYCTREFGFLSLPDSLTTGSSIMPQKKNPDIVELLRARCAKIRGYLAELQWIIAKLPSNYHRDFQHTKEPTWKGIGEISNILDSVELIVTQFRAHTVALKSSMHAELYATYEAYRQVHRGIPFRDAYKNTAQLVKDGKIKSSGYEKETAFIGQEVDRYYRQSMGELATHKKALSVINKRLSAIEVDIFKAV